MNLSICLFFSLHLSALNSILNRYCNAYPCIILLISTYKFIMPPFSFLLQLEQYIYRYWIRIFYIIFLFHLLILPPSCLICLYCTGVVSSFFLCRPFFLSTCLSAISLSSFLYLLLLYSCFLICHSIYLSSYLYLLLLHSCFLLWRLISLSSCLYLQVLYSCFLLWRPISLSSCLYLLVLYLVSPSTILRISPVFLSQSAAVVLLFPPRPVSLSSCLCLLVSYSCFVLSRPLSVSSCLYLLVSYSCFVLSYPVSLSPCLRVSTYLPAVLSLFFPSPHLPVFISYLCRAECFSAVPVAGGEGLGGGGGGVPPGIKFPKFK
jgi:hypothetical protein